MESNGHMGTERNIFGQLAYPLGVGRFQLFLPLCDDMTLIEPGGNA